MYDILPLYEKLELQTERIENMYLKITDLQKADIIAQYWKGKPVTALCKEYDVSKSTVYAWIRPCTVKEAAAAIGKDLFIQKEQSNLQRKMSRLNTIIEILGKTECQKTSPLEERLAEFSRLNGQYGTNVLLEALNISKGTYYNRILHNNAPSQYQKRYECICKEVREIFDESGQCYGSDKILAVLQSRGYRTSKQYVLRIMRDLGLKSIRAYSKHDYLAYRRKNIVNRQFIAEKPNQIWVGDIAQFMVKRMYFYICVVIDLFSRKVLAHKISTCCSAQLVTATFKKAYAARGNPEGLLFHSDQGTQYTSKAFRKLLVSYGVTQSFSYPGRPVDNAVAEAFFSNLKREELYRHDYKSEREFREAVSKYIMNYNTVRPHRNNNYKSPDSKELTYFNRVSE